MSTISPWDPAFYRTNSIVLVMPDVLAHGWDGENAHIPVCEEEGGGRTLSTEPEAKGIINKYTGVLTYPKNATGIKKDLREIERLRQDYISAQIAMLMPVVAKRFKDATSALDLFGYLDTECEDTKHWRYEDKVTLMRRVAWEIQDMRRLEASKKNGG